MESLKELEKEYEKGYEKLVSKIEQLKLQNSYTFGEELFQSRKKIKIYEDMSYNLLDSINQIRDYLKEYNNE